MSELTPSVASSLKNWKSTLSGVLTVTLATSAALAPLPWVAHHPAISTFVATSQVLAKVYLSLIQKD